MECDDLQIMKENEVWTKKLHTSNSINKYMVQNKKKLNGKTKLGKRIKNVLVTNDFLSEELL